MKFREWQLTDVLTESIDAVENLAVSVKEHLGEIKRSTLLEVLDQLGELGIQLNRLAYAVESAAPLAELHEQIAQNDAAERLGVQRARVEGAKRTRE